jgi:CheY-like chemotaxis protein
MTDAIDVLVIDDSATIRKLVEMSLRGTAFHVHFSASGADGVALARRVLPAAILLDCVLPDATGMQVCRQLAAEPHTRAIPILLVSAKPESVRAEFAGCDAVVDFIPKPFSGPDLVKRLRRALAMSTAEVERFDRDHQERAAKILYARLRDGFALVPAFAKQLGSSPPGPYFAKRLLTPEAVGGILSDLFELFDGIAGRREPAETVEPVSPSAILDRAPGFSNRVRNTKLGATARRILTLVDGQHALDQIASRLGLDVTAAGILARSLVDRGLVEDRTAARSRPVVILEPDVHGFQRPLASLLEARPEAPALVPVASVGEVVSTVRRLRPCLVVVNATSESSSVGAAARELRADTTLSDVALVAVLDRSQPAERDDLYSAGFDAVLSKPIIVGELERFIVPSAAIERKEEPWVIRS